MDEHRVITVIVSVFNEMNNPYFFKIREQFKDDLFFELIWVDGGSTDGTIQCLQQENMRVEVLKGSTRAARLNLGIALAKFSFILLQHPRAMIDEAGIAFIKKNHNTYHWAAFTHRFDTPHFFLKFISWYSNQIRVKKKNIVYLDHCMLVRKNDLQPMPDIAIFEDTALSHALRLQHKPILLPYVVRTSAVRFLKRGIYKQFLLNQYIKLLYSLKINDKKINRLYEKKVNLNQIN